MSVAILLEHLWNKHQISRRKVADLLRSERCKGMWTHVNLIDLAKSFPIPTSIWLRNCEIESSKVCQKEVRQLDRLSEGNHRFRTSLAPATEVSPWITTSRSSWTRAFTWRTALQRTHRSFFEQAGDRQAGGKPDFGGLVLVCIEANFAR